MIDLFTLETNLEFPARAQDPATIAPVAAVFRQGKPKNASLIEKHNRYSRLVIADCDAGRVVFRSCAADLRPRLELQAGIFAELTDVQCLRPIPAADGCFTTLWDDAVWMAYPYVAGPLFTRPGLPPLATIEASLCCLASLARWQRDHAGTLRDLPKTDRSVDADLARALLDPSLGEWLGNDVRDAVHTSAARIGALTERCAAVGGPADELVHSDLQHANIVAGAEGCVVIDVEDVCLDDRRMCASHAIFKLVRHAVFLGLVPREDARRRLIPAALDLAAKLGMPLGGGDGVMLLAARRTLADISSILNAARSAETRWWLYDLKKKVHNIFEIDELLSPRLRVCAS